jgi:hypothetical protein
MAELLEEGEETLQAVNAKMKDIVS